jgi:DHA2 family lincomycin resistance protein-like MFS transporter
VNIPPPGLAAPTPRRIGAAIALLVLSALVMILNETVLTVALPQLMADFSVGAATAQWLTTGFMLTMAVVIPTTGFLLGRFSTRALFAVAILAFLAGTALAFLATGFGAMLVARVVQACGTAVILPLLMTTTLHWVPARHRGTVMGLNSVVISVAPAVGPTLAGVIMHGLGWRWIFGLMLPVIALLWLVGVAVIRLPHAPRPARLDAGSVVLSAVGFGGLVYGFASVGTLFEGAWAPAAAVAVGLAALLWFAVRQRRLQRASDSALLDLRPFGVPAFRVAVALVMLAMAMMLGTVVVIPIYLQNGLGAAALATGLVLLPGGLLQGLASPFVGLLYDRIGPRPLVLPGAVLMAAGQWWFGALGAGAGLGLVVAVNAVFSVGMALVMTPLMAHALGALPRSLYPHGSAIMNTLQQLAGAAGTAILVAALTLGVAGGAGAAAVVAGAQAAFVVGGVLGLAAVAGSLLVRRLPATAESTTAPSPAAASGAPAAEVQAAEA